MAPYDDATCRNYRRGERKIRAHQPHQDCLTRNSLVVYATRRAPLMGKGNNHFSIDNQRDI